MPADKLPIEGEDHPHAGQSPIKHWKPRHDMVIALHLAGYKNVTIARRLDYDPNAVCRILKDPRAQKAIEEFRDRIASNTEHYIETRLEALSAQAIDRIAETLNTDFTPGSNAKKHQDGASFKLLELAGYGGRKEEEEAEEGGIRLPAEVAGRVIEALAKSEKATRIYEVPLREDDSQPAEEPRRATG